MREQSAWKQFIADAPVGLSAVAVAIAALFVFDMRDAVNNQNAAFAATQSRDFKYEVGISGQVISNPTTATFLTVPGATEHAWILVTGNPVCWSADASAPTATSGGKWPAGTLIKIDNDPLHIKALRLINCSEGATVVYVYYLRTRLTRE